MKRMVLGLSLSLVALGFLVSPAMAAPSPPQGVQVLSLADQDFLASLAIAPAEAPAPELAAKRPAIGEKSLCNATANCSPGTVTCGGNNSVTSCSAADRNCNVGERGHVTCDGHTTWCPAACPSCPPTWCTDDCSFCPCGGSLICNPYPTCTSHCKCKINCPP
jgi:hypothetical protein